MRVELVSDDKKRNNREMVKMKMEKTFSYRRYEVVRNTPMLQDFQARWPALFDVSEAFMIHENCLLHGFVLLSNVVEACENRIYVLTKNHLNNY